MRGHSHRRKRLPNQDSLLWTQSDEGVTIVAAADGHGSERSFRSDIGSRLAVNVAVEALAELGVHGSADALAETIVAAWRAAVREDVERTPFSEMEQQRGLPEHAEEPYGATLLAVAASAQRLRCVQLGDGDIVATTSDGRVKRLSVDDPRLIANETTSLSMHDAASEITIVDVDATDIDLVTLSTDGYSNSFVDQAAFEQVGPDILARLRTDGPQSVGRQVPDWLEAASREGSGDDITLAILWKRIAEDAGEGRKGAATSARRRNVVQSGALLAFGIAGGALAFWATDRGESSTSPRVAPPVSAPAPAAWTWRRPATLVRESGPKPAIYTVSGLPAAIEIVAVAAGGGSVWLADSMRNVYRIPEPSRTQQTVEPVNPTIPLPLAIAQLSYARGYLWATAQHGTVVFRIDPHTLVTRRISLGTPVTTTRQTTTKS